MATGLQQQIGANLRALILAQNRTIELFCHEHSIDKGWLSRILRGTRSLTLPKAIALAEALGCTLDDIYPMGKRK